MNSVLTFMMDSKTSRSDENLINPAMSRCDEVLVNPRMFDEVLINPAMSRCDEVLINLIMSNCDEILMNPRLERVSLDQYVNNLIWQSVIWTGVPSEELDDSVRGSVKRKALSPPSACQAQRAFKLRATGAGSSPDLRVRNGMGKMKGSPPCMGILSSPAVGRIKKCRRRITTPKRTYTPDKNQQLITSVFSPRPKTAPGEQ